MRRLLDWMLLLLGPILALVLSNAAFSLWGWPLLVDQDAGLPHTVQARLRTAEGADVVVLGSSVGVFAVDADRLSQRTGLSVLNASRHGASPQATAMMLPDVLRLRPAVVVHVLSPLELRADQVPDWERVYHPAIAWALLGGASVRAAPGEHLEGLLGWGSVLYRHREGLRRRAADTLGLKAARFELGGGAVAGLRAEHEAARFDGTGPNIDALAMMEARLSEVGSRLVLCLAPVRTDITGAHFPEAPTALFETLPHERVPVEALGRYSDGLFSDPVHLNASGTALFTDRLADRLR